MEGQLTTSRRRIAAHWNSVVTGRGDIFGHMSA